MKIVNVSYAGAVGSELPSAPPTLFVAPFALVEDGSDLLFDAYGEIPGAHVTIETNRGCPYGCTFCDWGSATMSRARKRGSTDENGSW